MVEIWLMDANGNGLVDGNGLALVMFIFASAASGPIRRVEPVLTQTRTTQPVLVD